MVPIAVNGKLKSHGNTKGQQITEAGKRNFKVFFLQMQDWELFDNIDQAADCGIACAITVA